MRRRDDDLEIIKMNHDHEQWWWWSRGVGYSLTVERGERKITSWETSGGRSAAVVWGFWGGEREKIYVTSTEDGTVPWETCERTKIIRHTFILQNWVDRKRYKIDLSHFYVRGVCCCSVFPGKKCRITRSSAFTKLLLEHLILSLRIDWHDWLPIASIVRYFIPQTCWCNWKGIVGYNQPTVKC